MYGLILVYEVYTFFEHLWFFWVPKEGVCDLLRNSTNRGSMTRQSGKTFILQYLQRKRQRHPEVRTLRYWAMRRTCVRNIGDRSVSQAYNKSFLTRKKPRDHWMLKGSGEFTANQLRSIQRGCEAYTAVLYFELLRMILEQHCRQLFCSVYTLLLLQTILALHLDRKTTFRQQ